MSAVLPRRPELTLEELQQLKWLLGAALTLLGVSTVFYMDIDAWSLTGLTAGVTFLSLWRPTFPGRVPSYVHTLAFPAIVAFFVADIWLRAEILPAMVRLDILLLLYRSLTYRQRRDDLQLIILGLFLIVVAGVLTVSLTFAAHLLVYTGCALALLLVITLTDAAAARVAVKPLAPGETPPWALNVSWTRLLGRLHAVTDWRVVMLGLVLFAGVVGVSALLFLAIPRFQLESSMFLDRLITKKARSGFSDSIRFGEVSDIQQDTSVALSVDVSDQSQIPASPYWRMLVLDSYENGTFKLSPALRAQEFGNERMQSMARGNGRSARPEPVLWTFYLESGVSRYLPLLGHFQALRFREQQTFRQAQNLGMVMLRDEPATMTAYRVENFEVDPVLRDPAFAARWKDRPAATRRAALQNRLMLDPADQAKLEQLVAEWTRSGEISVEEFARLAGDWLRRNHSYSLSPRIPGGTGDPLVRWLFSREPGHCELFAGSLVLLARTAGFPARVVTGFRGGSWNGYSNNFTIRNADAHAWVEIFDAAAGGWRRADALAVASSAAEEQATQGEAAMVSRLDRSWKARLDSLRVFWYRRIVSFDQTSQIETLRSVKDVTQRSSKRVRDALKEFFQSARLWLTAPWDAQRWTGVGLAVLAGCGVIWFWRAFGRGWWRLLLQPVSRGRREDPVRREASRWLQRLETLPTPVTDPATVAELQRLRFGPRATWGSPEAVFRRARQAARAAARERRPVTRSSAP